MPLTKEQIETCKTCCKSNKGNPPCLMPNLLARKHAHPLLTFVSTHTTDVKWPCYFHADWNFIAPLVIGWIPPKDPNHNGPPEEDYHQSDLGMRATPGGEYYLKMMRDDVRKVAGTKGYEAVKIARGPMGMNAADYRVWGQKVLLNGSLAVLYASHRDERYSEWTDGLDQWDNRSLMNLNFGRSKWKFVTYGGGGTLGVGASNVVLKSPEGTDQELDFVGYGLSTKWAALTASPNRFYTDSTGFFKNMNRYGSGEPPLADLEGFCLVLNASAAAAVGWGLSGPDLGAGWDISWYLFGALNPKGPAGVCLGWGKTAGFALGGGVTFGYIFPNALL